MRLVDHVDSQMKVIGVVGQKTLVEQTKDIKKEFSKQFKPLWFGILIYAYARKHMYENILEKYNPIYMDTDSAILKIEYYQKLMQQKPELFLKNGDLKIFGNLSDEFQQADEVYCFNPKNYFVFNENTLVKKGCKGVSLEGDLFLHEEEIPNLLDIKKDSKNKKNQ